MRLLTLAATFFTAALIACADDAKKLTDTRPSTQPHTFSDPDSGFLFSAAPEWQRDNADSGKKENPRFVGSFSVPEHQLALRVYHVPGKPKSSTEFETSFEAGLKQSVKEYKRGNLEFVTEIVKDDSFVLSFHGMRGSEPVTGVAILKSEPETAWLYAFYCPTTEFAAMKTVITTAMKSLGTMDFSTAAARKALDRMAETMKKGDGAEYQKCFDVDAILDGASKGAFWTWTEEDRTSARKKFSAVLTESLQDEGMKKCLAGGIEISDVEVKGDEATGTVKLIGEGGQTAVAYLTLKPSKSGWMVTKIEKAGAVTAQEPETNVH